MSNAPQETLPEIEIIKRWLKTKLAGVMNVQACFITHGNTLVVTTWTGVIVNVYLLDEAVKTRTIKRILQESGDLGIGSLFIVKRELLPDERERADIKEWLLAVHEVTRERVYTYTLYDDEPKLGQAHFEPIGSTGDFVTRHGPSINFEQFRCYRMSVKARFIKGDWYVADFGLSNFWHDPHKIHYQPNYRRPDTATNTTWHSWSQATWEQNQTTPLDKAPVQRDRLTISYELLEVSRDATRDEVKNAFRRLAFQLHPDTSQLPKHEAEKRFLQLTEAWEIIKEANEWN